MRANFLGNQKKIGSGKSFPQNILPLRKFIRKAGGAIVGRLY